MMRRTSTLFLMAGLLLSTTLVVSSTAELPGTPESTPEPKFVSSILFPIPYAPDSGQPVHGPIAAIYSLTFPKRVVLVLWEDGRMIWHEDFRRLTGPREGEIKNDRVCNGIYFEGKVAPEAIDRLFETVREQSELVTEIAGVPLADSTVTIGFSRNRWEQKFTIQYPAWEERATDVLWTPDGPIKLAEGETREVALARQPSDYQHYRRAADASLEVLWSLVPQDRTEWEEIGTICWEFRREGYRSISIDERLEIHRKGLPQP